MDNPAIATSRCTMKGLDEAHLGKKVYDIQMSADNYRRPQTNTETRLTSPDTAVPIHLTQLPITDRTKATDVHHRTAPWTATINN